MSYSHYFRSTGQKYKEIKVSKQGGDNKWITQNNNSLIITYLRSLHISKKVVNLQSELANFSY